jgi:hypothetical protein
MHALLQVDVDGAAATFDRQQVYLQHCHSTAIAVDMIFAFALSSIDNARLMVCPGVVMIEEGGG